jgi:hypothetical protein
MSTSSTPPPPPPPPPPPLRPPRPRNGGCLVPLLILVGGVLLLPGICAIFVIVQDPKTLLPSSRDSDTVWQLLLFGACGVAIIMLATRSLRR